jgi:hypothetical protein
MEERTRLTVTKLPNRDTLIIKQLGSPEFFVSSHNVIVIEIPTLSFLIKFLIMNNFISKKVIEGILSEITE